MRLKSSAIRNSVRCSYSSCILPGIPMRVKVVVVVAVVLVVAVAKSVSLSLKLTEHRDTRKSGKWK